MTLCKKRNAVEIKKTGKKLQLWTLFILDQTSPSILSLFSQTSHLSSSFSSSSDKGEGKGLLEESSSISKYSQNVTKQKESQYLSMRD